MLIRKAFTLIELLVVISIIGILASIVTTRVSNSSQKTTDVQTLATLRQVAELLDQETISTQDGSYQLISGADDNASWSVLLGLLPANQTAQLPPAGQGYAAQSDAAGYCLWKASRQDDTKTIYCTTNAHCSDKEGVDTGSLPANCVHL